MNASSLSFPYLSSSSQIAAESDRSEVQSSQAMAGEEDKDFDSFTLISTTSDERGGLSEKLKAGKEWLQHKQASESWLFLSSIARRHTV